MISPKGNTPTENTPKKNRLPNFITQEDVMLCHAYVHVSEDPITGMDQKGNIFWDRVHTTFMELCKQEDSNEIYLYRKTIALKTRFQYQIMTEVQRFNSFLFQITKKNHSCSTPESHMKEAHKRYKSAVDHPFIFELCLPVLNKMPKYNISYLGGKRKESVTTEAEVDSDIESLKDYFLHSDTKLECPVGNKKAKLWKKEDSGDRELDLGHNKILEQLVMSTDLIADTIKKKEKMDRWIKMATLCHEPKDKKHLKEYLDKLIEIDYDSD